MNPHAVYKEFEHFLRIVCRHKKNTIPYLLKSANSKVIKYIIEIAYNLIKGEIPLTKHQTKLLRKDKKNIKFLISTKNTLDRKKIVMYQNPQLVKTMLRIVFS